MSQLNPIPEVKPEIVFIYQLIKEIITGKMRIPKFQRRFIWTRNQMLDLFSSVYLQYPIGSILVWDADDTVSSTNWVGPIQISPTQPGPASHVLDGQQRLSTLVGVLQRPQKDQAQNPDIDDPDRWQIWFNAQKKDFEYLKSNQTVEAWHFPMSKLMNTVDFLSECKRIAGSGDDKAEDYINTIEELSQTFTAYKLPLIRIQNTKLPQAVDIFARMNSKGQTMSADQMVSALSYSEDIEGQPSFNLAEEIDNVLFRLVSLGFGELDRTVILRAFLAALEEDIYSSDWTRFSYDKREELAKKLPLVIASTSDALYRAAEFLHSLGVSTTRLLPYGMQLIVLAAFFLKCPSPTPEQQAFLRRWFWVSSFTVRFSSSNPSRDGELVAEFRDVISQTPSPSSVKNMQMDAASEPFPTNFDMRSARSRTLLLVMLSLNPRDELGNEIGSLWSRIEKYGSNAIGYIFARVNERELVSSPANRILRLNLKDRSQAKNWILGLQALPEATRLLILESHAIPMSAFEALLAGQTDEFLRQRRDHLIQVEKEFMLQEQVKPSLEIKPKPAAIDISLA